jgi:hypothetical protein
VVPSQAVDGFSRGRAAADARSAGTQSALAHGKRVKVLACLPLGPIVVAVDSAFIEGVADVEPADSGRPAVAAAALQPSSREELDLAARFGVNTSDAVRRRRLSVQIGAQRYTVLVGAEVVVREFSEPRPLPIFLREFGRAHGIHGYVEWTRGYVFVLDLAALFEERVGSQP